MCVHLEVMKANHESWTQHIAAEDVAPRHREVFKKSIYPTIVLANCMKHIYENITDTYICIKCKYVHTCKINIIFVCKDVANIIIIEQYLWI